MATETKLEGLEQELSTLLDVENFDAAGGLPRPRR